MKFCGICDNMFYLNISQEDSNRLCYSCRHCGNVENVNEASTVVSILNTETRLKGKQVDFSHIINKYTKYDPTLPVMENGVCPNEKCKGTRILYMRYDDENLKFVYICSDCDTYW